MMKRKLFVCPSRLAFAVALFLVATCGASLLPQAQKATSTDRERGQVMLRTIKDDLKKNYYDPTVRGMDLDARFKAAEEKMKQADSNSQIMGIIAQILVELDDSHTFFMPPARVSSVEYGWQVQSVGDKNYVVAVKPKSDAEAKGLQPGDEVLAVDGRKPSRAACTNDHLLQVSYTAKSLPDNRLSAAAQRQRRTRRRRSSRFHMQS